MTGNEIHSAGDYRGPNAKRHNHNYMELARLENAEVVHTSLGRQIENR
jgi:hypothetical protein